MPMALCWPSESRMIFRPEPPNSPCNWTTRVGGRRKCFSKSALRTSILGERHDKDTIVAAPLASRIPSRDRVDDQRAGRAAPGRLLDVASRIGKNQLASAAAHPDFLPRLISGGLWLDQPVIGVSGGIHGGCDRASGSSAIRNQGAGARDRYGSTPGKWRIRSGLHTTEIVAGIRGAR